MLQDVIASIQTVFGNASAISLVIMLVVVLAGGLALHSFGRLVSVTFWALVVYGLAELFLLLTKGVGIAELPDRGWSTLKTMMVNDLVVYFIAFAVLISVVHLVSGAVRRD